MFNTVQSADTAPPFSKEPEQNEIVFCASDHPGVDEPIEQYTQLLLQSSREELLQRFTDAR